MHGVIRLYTISGNLLYIAQDDGQFQTALFEHSLAPTTEWRDRLRGGAEIAAVRYGGDIELEWSGVRQSWVVCRGV